MNQGQFIEAVMNDMEAQGYPIETHAQAERIVKSVMNNITQTLVAGDEVRFAGFGSFKTRVNKARVGRNPQTGDEIKIPETRVVKFTPGKTLKTSVK